MAEESNRARKPRIRKVAPTVREKVEAATVKSLENKPSTFKKVTSKIPRPKVSVRLPKVPSNPVFRVIGRILSKLAPRYFINAWRELRQVTWPNRKETWRLTLAVFIFATVFGALVAGVDKGLDVIFKHTILK